MPSDASPALSALEARVLGVLVEKQATVPDTYPLSLNALVAGCNQKTSRDPVMNVGDAEVLEAIESLRSASLVIESSGSRVTRYAHNTAKVLQVPSAAVAVLATLALRGPQTAAELRANSERLHRFADVSAVEAYLDELARRPAGALVVELPRQPGSRENRWMHTLCGAPAAEARPEQATGASQAGAGIAHGATSARADGSSDLAALESRLARLEGEVDELRLRVERLASEPTR